MRLSLLLAAAAAIPLSGQNAEITGIVRDPQDAVIPGASVIIANQTTGTRRAASSNHQGLYFAGPLAPGAYQITVTAPGFETEIRNAQIEICQTVRLDFQVRLGNTQEKITVDAGAPLLQTETAVVGTVVNRQFVENMPLNGRSFQSLLELTPGIVATPTSYQAQGQFSVNGQRPDANYFTVDGASANGGIGSGGAINGFGTGSLPTTSANGGFNNMASIDALQEFRIETSSVAPEFGRSPGGQISLVTRSGGNRFTGALFDYLRNDALDAMDWFANNKGLRKPSLRQNDFGGVLGGPIKKDKLFFFFSYEGLRLRSASTTLALVPSLDARQTAAPGIRPILANAFPLPNGPVTSDKNAAQYNANLPSRSALDATSIRMDYNLSDRMTLFGRYNYAPSNSVVHNSVMSTITEFGQHTATIGHTFIVTPNMSNDFRANYSHSTAGSSYKPDFYSGPYPAPDPAAFPVYVLFYTFTSFDPLYIGPLAENYQHQWNFVDSLSWAKGAHRFKFGADIRDLLPTLNNTEYNLVYSFNSTNTALNGAPDAGSVSDKHVNAYRFFNFSAFAQDAWKVSARLTVTYGVRWDVNPAPGSVNNAWPYALTNFDANNLSALNVLPFGARPYPTTWNNFAPRMGVAWRLSQSANWGRVLRGGAGIFYDTGHNASAFTSGPYAVVKDITKSVYPPTAADLVPNPLVLTPPFNRPSQANDPHFKLPYSWQFNAGLEQALGSNQSLTVSYVGALGRRLVKVARFFNPSPVFPNQTLSVYGNYGSSDYHALQAQFHRRMSHGLHALASYVWSHSLDNASQYNFSDPGGFLSPNIDRGSSDFDLRHSLSAAIGYRIPTALRTGWGKLALGNWSTDWIYRAQSARAVDLSAGNVTIVPGLTLTRRPDLVAGVPLYLNDPSQPGGKRINRAAFVVPPSTSIRQGTLGRNVIRGYGIRQVDLALRREFPLTEHSLLQFRADLFNLFNHPNFAPPISALTNAQFGQSVSMLSNTLGSGNSANGGSGGFSSIYQLGGPRSIQLSMKLRF